MLSFSFVSRRPADSRTSRTTVCPPAIRTQPGWQAVLRDWLAQRLPHVVSSDTRRARRSPLFGVKQCFIASISQVTDANTQALLDKIHFARSLRELWHLRADVFELVARCHGEREAATRLAELNRHFRMRMPSTGHGPLSVRGDLWP